MTNVDKNMIFTNIIFKYLTKVEKILNKVKV